MYMIQKYPQYPLEMRVWEGKTAPHAAGSVLPGESFSSSSTLPGKIFTWRKAVLINPAPPQVPATEHSKGFMGLRVALGTGRDLLTVSNSYFCLCHHFCYVTKCK